MKTILKNVLITAVAIYMAQALVSCNEHESSQETTQPTPEDTEQTSDKMPDLEVMGKVSIATYNAGCGLADDRKTTTSEDALMKVISNTTAERLDSYTQTLKEHGYKLLNENILDGDRYYTFEKNGKLYYLYHSFRVGETRVIEDSCSDPLSGIAYEYNKKAGETTEFYQYSINYKYADIPEYDPVVYTESDAINCGMCYIIKLADNSVIVVDSGHQAQSTAKSREGFVKFLKKITNTPEGEKVKVAMWFFTHAHGDHVRLAADVLNGHHDDINLVSVTHNFTSYHMKGKDNDNTFLLKQAILKHYPDVLFHKLHTGESFTMADVKIEVVYTHEDATDAWAKTEISDYNSSSTVLKITMDGEIIMVLGDISEVAEEAMVAIHSAEYFQSDAVQVAHHGFNNLTFLYPKINAKIALFPQSPGEEQKNSNNRQAYNTIMTYAEEEYFAHKYTYKFTVVNGEFEAEALPRYDAQ